MNLKGAGMGVNDACPSFACTITGTCRLPTHGNAPGDCGSDSAQLLATTSGLFRSQLSSEQISNGPDCSTLEDRPIDGDRLQESYYRGMTAGHPLWLTLQAPEEQKGAARAELTKQTKLMFEMGISFPDMDPEAIREEYFANPQFEAACGVSGVAPVPPSCLSWGAEHGFDGALAVCQRMLSSHVAPEVFDRESALCLDLLARPELKGTSNCAIEYRKAIAALDERLLGKSIAKIAVPPGGTTISGITPALGRIDRWYTAASLAFSADQVSLAGAISRVLASFWTQVYSVASPIPAFVIGESGTEIAKSQLASLVTSRLEADRQVLVAAYSDPAPLDEVPLLLLSSDALVEMSDRLTSAASLYDFACRFKRDTHGAIGCTAANANEATQLIRLIGAIGDEAALASALASSAGVRTPWREVFSALKANRGALETALRKATGRPDATLMELYLPSPVSAAAPLAEKVAVNQKMWESYAASGVLLPRDGNLLNTSLVDSKVVSTLQSFLETRNALTTQRQDFQRSRGDFAKAVADRIANQQFQDRINNEMASARTDYDNLGRDLDGLMNSQDLAEHQIGRFMSTYVQRASSPGWLPEYPVAGPSGVVSVNARSSRGTGVPANNIPAVAVPDPNDGSRPWHLDMGRGDLLTLDVSGAWSPTCALRTTTLAGPNSTSVFTDPTHLLVGPEGFSVSWDNTKFAASDHSSSDFSSQVNRASVCGSIGANLLGVIPLPGGELTSNISVSASACREWQTGHSDTSSSTDGSRFQSSSSFAGGLRVPGTPIPTAPGGSLLLVEVIESPNGTGTVRDVHVVRSHSSFLFPQAVRVYLVANDKSCLDVDTSALTVNFVHAKSSATSAKQLVEAMSNILTTLQAQRAAYVAQGSVSAAELAALQSNAYDQLRAACGCSVSAFPEEVRGMIDAWLSAEIASTERATRIASAERALDSLVLRLKALRDDLSSGQSSSRLLSLMTYWQLAHLAYPQLRTFANIAIDSANSNLIPVMQTLYPSTFGTVGQAASGLIENLRVFDWTLPYDEHIKLFEDLTEVVRLKINDARVAGSQSTPPLVIVFPKPGTTVNVPGAITAPPERLSAVWQTCASGVGSCLRRKPTFTITPEDVYGRALVGLGCREAAPVIQTFALVSVNNGGSGNDNWNTNPRRADIMRGPDMVFPVETGLLSFRTDGLNGVLVPTRVRVLASSDTSVGSTYEEFIRRPGGDLHGVSPFGSFTLDLGNEVTTASPLVGSSALVVYFDLQTRTATSNLAGVGACAQPASFAAAAAHL